MLGTIRAGLSHKDLRNHVLSKADQLTAERRRLKAEALRASSMSNLRTSEDNHGADTGMVITVKVDDGYRLMSESSERPLQVKTEVSFLIIVIECCCVVAGVW